MPVCRLAYHPDGSASGQVLVAGDWVADQLGVCPTVPAPAPRPLGVCRIVIAADGTTRTEILVPGALPPGGCHVVHEPAAPRTLPSTGIDAGLAAFALGMLAAGVLLRTVSHRGRA